MKSIKQLTDEPSVIDHAEMVALISAHTCLHTRVRATAPAAR